MSIEGVINNANGDFENGDQFVARIFDALFEDRPNEAIAIALASIAESLWSIQRAIDHMVYPDDGDMSPKLRAYLLSKIPEDDRGA